jgi:hypothetical protein
MIYLKRETKLSLYLVDYGPIHDDLQGSGGRASPFLNSALDGERSASRSVRFTSKERVPYPVLIVQKTGWAPKPI